jgi:hypothetical protein
MAQQSDSAGEGTVRRMGEPDLEVLGTNIALVPSLGDLFDAAWKSNQKNVALLG